MGRLSAYLDMVKQSRLLAPNLKEMTLRLSTDRGHAGNSIGRTVVKNHLLALRWMNPNAVIYLRESVGAGRPEVEYTLWSAPGERKVFEIRPSLTAEEVVAKVMMACRDPAEEEAPHPTAAAISPVAATTAPATAAAPTSPSLPASTAPASGGAGLGDGVLFTPATRASGGGSAVPRRAMSTAAARAGDGGVVRTGATSTPGGCVFPTAELR